MNALTRSAGAFLRGPRPAKTPLEQIVCGRLATAMVLVLAPGCRREDPAQLLHAARTHFAAGRLEDAEDRLGRLAQVRPLTVAERILRAQVAHDRGRLDEALKMLDDPRGRGPERGPDAALLSTWRGSLEMERHRFRVAEAHLRRAVALAPARSEARRRLVDLCAIQHRSADVDAEARALARSETLDFASLYAWTLGEREGADPAEQAGLLQDAVRADPDDRASRLALAETLRRLGRLDEAATALSGPRAASPEVRAIAARIALDRGKAEDAEAILATARGTDREDAPGLDELRGRIALLRDDPRGAVQHFEAALRADPERRDAHFGLGQALRLVGNPAEARPHLKAARECEHLEWLVRGARPPARRSSPAVLREIGAACLAVGRRDLARAWYRRALAEAPGDPDVQSDLFRLESADLAPQCAGPVLANIVAAGAVRRRERFTLGLRSRPIPARSASACIARTRSDVPSPQGA